jgi:amino acid adenylation domain-containing protein
MSYRPKPKFSTLVELLRWRAKHQSDQLAYLFLVDGKTEASRLTYAELDRKAQAIGAKLQGLGGAGERALLFFPPGLDFITSFLGCLYASVIAVPVNSPGLIQLARGLPRLQTIVADSKAKWVLTTSEIAAQAESMLCKTPKLKAVEWVITENLQEEKGARWVRPALNSNTIAFLQYTSGSTSLPKGVMISHGNLLHNCFGFHQSARLSPQDCMVSWLPHFHDMGLIASIIESLYVGMRCILMAPASFIRRPCRWLEAISRYGGTVSCAPNFAYELCLRKVTIKQRSVLDLSTWEIALNGAEPVRHETIERFSDMFAPCGFRKESFYPAYGLAEATVFVSGGSRRGEPIDLGVNEAALRKGVIIESEEGDAARNYVGCGKSLGDQKMVTVNPESYALCRPDQVGEIWISGPSVPQGYWNRPEETEETFRGYLSDHGEGVFLRTGDLGFLKDGELFITGRIKDIIIIRGANYYPQDIELTVEKSHPALNLGGGAAFSVEVAGEECLVVVQEVKGGIKEPEISRCISSIRQTVSEEHGLQVYAVVLIHRILKTSSGKVQRQACKTAFLQGGLQVVAQWQAKDREDDQPVAILPENEKLLPQLQRVPPGQRLEILSTYIKQTIAGVLRIGEEEIPIDCNLMALGLDSIKAMELLYVWEKDLSIKLLPQEAFEKSTVRSVAKRFASTVEPMKDGVCTGHRATCDARIVHDSEHRNIPFPLTDIQHAYWFGRGDALDLGNVSCHVYLELESEDINIKRLSFSLQLLIQRHEMLRAVILPDSRQQILDQVPDYEIKVLDITGQPPDVTRSQLDAIRQSMSHQILPSDRWPLFDIRSTRFAENRVRLHISFDLLIADARSIQIIAKELYQLYQKPETLLVPLELSFRDYVLWERGLKDSDDYRRSRDYWIKRLPTLPPAPELPLVQKTSSVTQPRFKRRFSKLERDAWQRLKIRALEAELTFSVVLLAAFAEVLSVWSKSPYFTLNLTLFNRPPIHPQVNDIVGDFTSLNLLEVDCSVNDTFETRARRLQGQLWNDLDHRYINGVDVMREFAREKGITSGIAMPVVFTSTLGLDGSDKKDSAWSPLGNLVYSVSQTPQVWLDHQVYEQAGELILVWDTVDALFPDGLPDEMFAAYYSLLMRLSKDKRAWQETNPRLIPDAQLKRRAVVNATEAPVSCEMLHTLFAAQVSRRPDQTAAIASDFTLSYEELFSRSNHTARLLREKGAQPNSLVAVVMEKGWEQVVAVLGILNSGAAYFPIDPSVPKERLWYLLENGEVRLILSQSWLDNKLQWPDNIECFSVDKMELTDKDANPLDPVQGPEELAYVIYTSGSTGLPKGVMIDHRGAVNTILDVNKRFGVRPEDRVFALSNLNFDLSVYDIFGTLAAGGTIILPEATGTKDPAHWSELMARERVTVWNSVPTLMQMLVEYASGRTEAVPQSLRLVLLSGDWIPLDLPDKVKALVDGVQVISLGGATEASIWSNLYPIEEVDPEWKSIPYGRPMTNQRLYVLNEFMEDCPDWVPGQLHIGGIGLAEGYWRDEEKTEASFMLHPTNGERLYRTGDLGRYLPDGHIEFVGREDFQVKISGYRIELGEIEAVLKEHSRVRDAIVTAVGDHRGDKRLVGYVILYPKGAVNVHEGKWPVNHSFSPYYAKHYPDGVELLAPAERLEFKMGKPGVRKEKTDNHYVQFVKPVMDEAWINKYSKRLSYRKFEKESIELVQFGEFLRCLLVIEVPELPFPRYQYGSAGGLYPVQIYVYIKPDRVRGLSRGIYYHNPINHRFILISDDAHTDRGIFLGNEDIFDESAFAIFLIADLDAIFPMYGVRSRNLCMIEAGLITQLLETSSFANEIGLCQIGELDFPKIRHMFGLKESHEYLHCLLGGRVNHPEGWSFLHEASEMILTAQPAKLSPDAEIKDELTSFLKQRLPEYMVPSAFMVLDELPLTFSGKVNRKALPMPGVVSSKVSYVAPKNEMEQTIAAILQDVLDVRKVGINNNFFEMGANSLHLVRIKNRLRKEIKKDVSIVDFFLYPTISTLAMHMRREGREDGFIQKADKRVETRRALRQRRLQKIGV